MTLTLLFSNRNPSCADESYERRLCSTLRLHLQRLLVFQGASEILHLPNYSLIQSVVIRWLLSQDVQAMKG